MKYKLMFFIFLITITGYSQTAKAISKIEAEHQKCLDNTNSSMLNCTNDFYTKMDSLLNIVYKEIKLPLNKSEQQKLKEHQLLWLKKRDAYFKKVEKETKELLDGDSSSQDYRMICANSNALFVKERIIELDKLYKK